MFPKAPRSSCATPSASKWRARLVPMVLFSSRLLSCRRGRLLTRWKLESRWLTNLLWAENPILGVLTTLPGRTTNVPTAPTALPCKKTGEQAYGIDIWLKSTPYLDVEKRYDSERRGLAEAAALRKQGRAQEADSVLLATTYHRDHGTGLDCYKVGPSLGCGTPAVLLGDSLVLPWCFERYEVKENGPLRFSVELTYPAKRIDKEMLREHRLISLSKGDYFNRMTVWYEGMKKKSQIDVCGGLVVHTKRTADLTLADDFIAYTDPTDNDTRHNFEIYVAVVFPDGINETRLIRDPRHERQGIVGNAIGVKRGLTAGATFTYWFGASWHKSGTADQAAWLSQIKRFVSNQRQPLQLSISKKE